MHNSISISRPCYLACCRCPSSACRGYHSIPTWGPSCLKGRNHFAAPLIWLVLSLFYLPMITYSRRDVAIRLSFYFCLLSHRDKVTRHQFYLNLWPIFINIALVGVESFLLHFYSAHLWMWCNQINVRFWSVTEVKLVVGFCSWVK